MGAKQNPRLGRYVVKTHDQETVRAFVPPPLPPDPPVRLDSLQRLLEQANQSLGRLDGLASVLPTCRCSSTPTCARRRCSPPRSRARSRRCPICCCSRTTRRPACRCTTSRRSPTTSPRMNHGLERLRGGFPLSLAAHPRDPRGPSVEGPRAATKQPGEFRRSQNWIGGTRPGNAAFVPPPPRVVLDCMSALELFLHDDRPDLPLLIKAGLAHVQFETIHPFLDGNGRLGRLLITLPAVRGRRSCASRSSTSASTSNSTGRPTTTCWTACGPRATGRPGSSSS